MNYLKTGLLEGAIAIAGSQMIAEAPATTVSVDGKTYDLTTLFGSFDENAGVLEDQPWWGDEGLAIALADEVEFDLGDFNGDFPAEIPMSPVFAFEAGQGVAGAFATPGISCVGSCHGTSDEAAYAVLVKNAKFLRPDAYTLAPDFIPSNVPTCSGSKFVSGFQILGGGKISWYADASKKDECFDGDITFLPEGVSAKDVAAVLAHLGNPELDVFRMQ